MSDIHPVSITDIPEEATGSSAERKTTEEPKEEGVPYRDSRTRILVNIRMTNGIRISKANLSHRELTQLVEKLEALC